MVGQEAGTALWDVLLGLTLTLILTLPLACDNNPVPNPDPNRLLQPLRAARQHLAEKGEACLALTLTLIE